MTIPDWTRSQTVSPPQTIVVRYTNQQGEQRSVSLQSTNTSETITSFQTIDYADAEGKPQTADVATRKVETNRTTQAAVNQALVVSRLSRGLSLPSGDALEVTTTTYEYIISTTGPIKVREFSETQISVSELAGSLKVPSYEYYTPGTGLIVAARREIIYNTVRGTDGRESTQTVTRTWRSNGRRSEGQTGFAEAMEGTSAIWSDSAVGGSFIANAVLEMAELVFEGAEVTIDIGRASVPQKPADQELVRDEVNNGGGGGGSGNTGALWEGYDNDFNSDGIPDWAPYVPGDWEEYDTDTDDDGVPDWAPFVPDDSEYNPGASGETSDPRRSVSGVVLFQNAAYNAADNTDTASYDLPFAPDDVFEYVNGVRRLIPGGARAAARRFGDTQAALAVGHAFGQNIVTSFDKLPTRDLDPVYIRVAGIEGAFLMDGTSYAWDSNGLVVGADLMLVGVTGYYGAAPPATSWLRLPVPTIGLPKID